MPLPRKYADYRRRGTLTNVVAARLRKRILRTVVSCLGDDWRWRVMEEDALRATGTCSSRKKAVAAANVVLRAKLKGMQMKKEAA